MIVLNFYWPAVSHICSLTLSPLSIKDLKRKSTPMVARKTSLKSLSAYRITIEDLPTHEFPTKTTLKRCKYYPLLIVIMFPLVNYYIIISILFKQSILKSFKYNLAFNFFHIDFNLYYIRYNSMFNKLVLVTLFALGALAQHYPYKPDSQSDLVDNLKKFFEIP